VDADGDGIGDTPYVIDANNQDRYPLMRPWSSLPVHNINTGLGYAKIQEAINANETLDGHTIFAEAGIYYELVFVNKTIYLLGEGRVVTVIDGEVDVTANGVVISGFAVGGFTAFVSGMRMWFGVRLSGADCTVSNNIVFNTGMGIWLLNSTNNVISDNVELYSIPYSVYLGDSSNNTISQNYIGSIEWKGLILPLDYGIDLYRSSNNTIIQNNVTQCRRAIRMEGVMPPGELQSDASNNTIIENNIEHREWGISLSQSSNNTIVGNNITALGGRGEILPKDSTGVSLYRSFNNSIIKNNIEQNGEGIKLVDSSLNKITGNNLTENFYGMWLQGSQVNSLIGNNITHSRVILRDGRTGVIGYGILISYPYYSNLLRSNSIAGYMYNFGVEGYMTFYAQDVDETNTVDGKPVYYWVNRRDGQIPSDAGYVAIVNSTNIKVEGLDLKNNYQGILVAYSSNTTIRQNNIANNLHGIQFVFSFNNTVLGNNIIANNENGVSLRESCNNIIHRNNITNPYETGICLETSSNNTLSQNNIANNTVGICLITSLNNTVSGNNIMHNYCGVGFSSSISLASSNNTIYHNDFMNNTNHVEFWPKSCENVWDDGYPSGGNHWSGYVGVDVKCGSGQDLPGSDGIGDTPYIIDADNVDRYPLMNPYGAPPPQTYDLTITTTAGETTNPSPGTYSYTANSTIQVTAIPEADYVFKHWELDDVDVGSANPYTVLMDEDHTLRAVFSPVPAVPVGGYSIPIQVHTKAEPIISYIALIAILATIFAEVKRKTNRKH